MLFVSPRLTCACEQFCLLERFDCCHFSDRLSVTSWLARRMYLHFQLTCTCIFVRHWYLVVVVAAVASSPVIANVVVSVIVVVAHPILLLLLLLVR